MKLYHGSSEIIKFPEYGKGKPYNDYGVGFYCTKELDMAKEWAVGRNKAGYANCYELDERGLTLLDLNTPEYCILNWLAILLENREFDAPSVLAAEAKQYIREHFLPSYKEYDLIKGYRADDSYFSFAQDFINGTISYRQLNRAMHLGRLGQQVVLKSRKAFDRIVFDGYEAAEPEEWFRKKCSRDKKARRDYFDVERNKRQKGDLYIAQIMDEEMMSDDLRLR